MTTAAIVILGADQWEDLIAAILMIAPGLVDELDPFALAALQAVNHRCEHHVTYRWSRAARGMALSLTISAAIEAEQRSRRTAAA